jgi:CheY-like chemotaxis protein
MIPMILLVEDNPTDEKLTRRAFQRCALPHQMLIVRDGAEALEYVFAMGNHAGRDPAAAPAVILLDLKLPRMSGLEVIQRIRADARTRLLPIVVLTASGEAEDVQQSYELGANAYVRKPVDFTQFVDTASIIGRFWVGANELPLTARLLP